LTIKSAKEGSFRQSSRLRPPRFAGLTPRQRDAAAWRASVVSHGVCIEIGSGRWKRTDDAALRRLVDALVEPVIAAETTG
jgi:hypothetical protein